MTFNHIDLSVRMDARPRQGSRLFRKQNKIFSNGFIPVETFCVWEVNRSWHFGRFVFLSSMIEFSWVATWKIPGPTCMEV